MTLDHEDRITALEKASTQGVVIENFYNESDDTGSSQLTIQYSNGIQIVYGSSITAMNYITKFIHPFKKLLNIDHASINMFPFVVGSTAYGNATGSTIGIKVYTPDTNNTKIRFIVGPAGTATWMALGYWK